MHDAHSSPYQAWFDGWLKKDYSWAGLLQKQSWTSGQGSLQQFLRELTRLKRTDEQLKADGILLECGDYGLYHVLFIPPEWGREKDLIPLSEEELVSHQASIWEALRTSTLREHFAGTITGVHLTRESAQALMHSTRASFEWAAFHGRVDGIVKQFNRSFKSCIFLQEVVLAGHATENRKPAIKFFDCECVSDVTIRAVEGVKDIIFDTCSVHGHFEFENLCEARVRFEACTLSTLDADGCIFKEELIAFETVITDRLSFARCIFDNAFSLVSIDLKRAMEVLDCDFKGRVTLTEISWPAPGRFVASAEGSKFYSTVSLAGRYAPPVQLFHNAEFTSAVALPSISDRELRHAFYSELAAPGDPGENVDTSSSHEKAVEGGCRALQKLAEQRGDVHLEHFWHRAEIIARRVRGDTSAAERLFSTLYGLFADYGLSISRPFLALGALTGVLTLVYAWLGGPCWLGVSIDWASLEEALGFSLNRVIPVGVFGDDVSNWRKDLLGSGGDLPNIAIRTLATAQSIASAILIYLGVMAIRRKFRIS
jgi:hypothetical protein